MTLSLIALEGKPPTKIYFRSTTDPDTLRGYSVSFVHMDEGGYSPYDSYKNLQATLREQETGNQLWVTTTPNLENPLNWVGVYFGDEGHWPLYRASTLQNPYVGDEFKQQLIGEYSKELAQVELEGLFIPLAGNCFFDTSVLRSMLDTDVREPMEERRNGAVRIFKPYGIGKRYVAGIDTAEGRQAGDVTGGEGNPDFQCLRVLDFNTGEDVASIHSRMPVDEFMNESVKLGKEYNWPYVGVEINFHREAAKKLIELGWPKAKVYHHADDKPGWLTTVANRIPMLSGYEEAVRSRSVTIYDRECLMEHLSFIRDKNGRPQGAYNAHDDYVMAGALAWAMRLHAKFNVASGPKVRRY